MVLPHQIPDEAKNILISKLKAGDKSVINELVNGHIRLAISIVSKYSRNRPNYKDEFISLAMCSLVTECHNIANGVTEIDDNLTGYLTSRIHSVCANYNGSSLRRSLYTNDLVRVNVGEATIESELSYSDLKELIQLACRTPRDRHIVELRRQQYTYEEIGEKLNLNTSWICKLLREIESRFDKLVKEIKCEP